jgi:hypothetical protein
MANLKSIAFASAAAMLLAGTAQAQYSTTPNIYGHPEFGTTTTGPNGNYQTMPNIYGHPEFGTTTTGGPSGRSCQTMPNIYGHPEQGVTTTCN